MKERSQTFPNGSGTVAYDLFSTNKLFISYAESLKSVLVKQAREKS